MTVFYRMCDIPSTNPSPILQGDKFALNKLCLKSFVQAFLIFSPKIIFICDFCDERYDKMIAEIVPFQYEIEHTEVGINETCLMQYRMARDTKDMILFQECDYFYLPHAAEKIYDAVLELGIVSPYDNRSFYIMKDLHAEEQKIRLIGEQHWRTTERNTMTFAIDPIIFQMNYDTFMKYGYLDGDVWYDLKRAGHELWSPLPSLATHMVKDWLAPGIDWDEKFQTYL